MQTYPVREAAPSEVRGEGICREREMRTGTSVTMREQVYLSSTVINIPAAGHSPSGRQAQTSQSPSDTAMHPSRPYAGEDGQRIQPMRRSGEEVLLSALLLGSLLMSATALSSNRSRCRGVRREDWKGSCTTNTSHVHTTHQSATLLQQPGPDTRCPKR